MGNNSSTVVILFALKIKNNRFTTKCYNLSSARCEFKMIESDDFLLCLSRTRIIGVQTFPVSNVRPIDRSNDATRILKYDLNSSQSVLENESVAFPTFCPVKFNGSRRTRRFGFQIFLKTRVGETKNVR